LIERITGKPIAKDWAKIAPTGPAKPTVDTFALEVKKSAGTYLTEWSPSKRSLATAVDNISTVAAPTSSLGPRPVFLQPSMGIYPVPVSVQQAMAAWDQQNAVYQAQLAQFQATQNALKAQRAGFGSYTFTNEKPDTTTAGYRFRLETLGRVPVIEAKYETQYNLVCVSTSNTLGHSPVTSPAVWAPAPGKVEGRVLIRDVSGRTNQFPIPDGAEVFLVSFISSDAGDIPTGPLTTMGGKNGQQELIFGAVGTSSSTTFIFRRS